MEDNILKRWLISFISLIVLQYGTILLGVILLKTVDFDTEKFKMLASATSKHILNGIITLPFIWITYHCAYRKKGTVWLTFILICFSCSIAYTLIYSAVNWQTFKLLPFIIDIPLQVYFWFTSYQLYKSNSQATARAYRLRVEREEQNIEKNKI